MDDEDDVGQDRPTPAGRLGGWGEKSTREEMEVRIDTTVRLLARRLYKSDIKRQLKKLFNVSARTCEVYISRARKVIVEWSGKTREVHRVDSLALYESVLRESPDARMRMDAQGRIDKLLGLEAPAQLDVRGEPFKVYLGWDPAEALCESPPPTEPKSSPPDVPTDPTAPPLP